MSENWSVIKQDVQTFRSYVKRLPAAAMKRAAYCYLLKKEEIDRLLSLRGEGQPLDGIRIYLGANMVEGHLVPNVHVVVCEKDGNDYNDYNVPGELPHVALGVETGVKPLAFAASATSTDPSSGSGGSTGTTAPCPTFCGGKSNILNS